MKYKLTENSIEVLGKKLFQIKALKAFGSVEKGELGGYIENEKNLNQEGDAWVSDNARVYDNARIYGKARIYGNAWIYGNARVYGKGCVCGNAWISDNARIYGRGWISDYAWISGNAKICGNAQVYGNAWVSNKLKLRTGFYFGMQYERDKILKLKVENGDCILWKKLK